MSNTETIEALELEETADPTALEGSNAAPDIPGDGAGCGSVRESGCRGDPAWRVGDGASRDGAAAR